MNNYYRAIPSEKMSDYFDFYEKIANQLPDQSNIIEVGIAEGRSIIMMASIMRNLGKRCRIWGIDNWDYGGASQREIVVNHVIRSGEDNITIIDKSSLDASCEMGDDFFHHIFLDSSHRYDQTKAEIRLWMHKVKRGYWLSGHDYNYSDEVKRAVDELIPEDKLTIEETTFNLGIWSTIIDEDFKLLK